MIRFCTLNRCPRCEHFVFDRHRRTRWMRLIPGSRLYKCRRCETPMLVLFKRWCLARVI